MGAAYCARGDVLYLRLEDTFYRIQDRLFCLTDEASENLYSQAMNAGWTRDFALQDGKRPAQTAFIACEYRFLAAGPVADILAFVLCAVLCRDKLAKMKNLGNEQKRAGGNDR